MEISETTIIEEVRNIKKSSEELIGKNERYLFSGEENKSRLANFELSHQVDTIIEEYNWIIPYATKFLKEIEIDLELKKMDLIESQWDKMKKGNFLYIVDNRLRAISLLCGRIISIFNNLATKTLESKNQFEGLKKEIGELKKLVPINTYKNLKEALEEFESNHLLSSTLICGRIIIFHLDSISHQIGEVIGKLKEKNLLQTKGSNEQILKANKKVRGLFAHDLNYFPSPSEALSIFGDTINIVKKVYEYTKKKKEESTSTNNL